jgi:hypothetical protein
MWVDLPKVITDIRDSLITMSGSTWFEIFRWTALIGILAAIWVPWRRWFGGRLKENSMQPTVASGQPMYGWLTRVDEAVAGRAKIRDHHTAVGWSEGILESFDRLLGDTELAREIKRSFAELMAEVRKTTRRRSRKQILDKAVQLLKDYRSKVTADDLR